MRLLLSALLAIAAGCIPHTPPVQAPAPMPTALVAVLTRADEGGGSTVGTVADPVQHALEAVLKAHNLDAIRDPNAVAAFGSRRSTALRLGWMGSALNEVPLMVLVEAEARFFSQLGGQYRWTVAVSVSVQARDGAPTTDSFEVPVFLSYDHEAEPEALDAALPVIEQRLGALLDNALRGLAAPPPQANGAG